jgi:hypothetical protein
MSSEERKKILDMVADGKISAEEAATLMRALDDDSAEAEVEVYEAVSGMGGERSERPSSMKSAGGRGAFRARSCGSASSSPYFSAYGMFAVQQSTGINFWFLCLGMPLTLGILLTSWARAAAPRAGCM